MGCCSSSVPAADGASVRCVTELLLVRHGQTDWNVQGRFQGHADRPLSAAGRIEAEALSVVLGSERLDAIYTSDLRRALETAQIIGEARGMTVTPLRSLREAETSVRSPDSPERRPASVFRA